MTARWSLDISHRGGCWEISQGMRFLRTLGILRLSGIRTLKGCRGLLASLPGCDSWCVSIPGVRKKRVPLANLLAPLRGALTAVYDRRYSRRMYLLFASCITQGWHEINQVFFILETRVIHDPI